MRKEELEALFNQQAAGYDAQSSRMAPIRDGLHLLLGPVFAGLPPDARVLCVGVGTGLELAHLAPEDPRWRFTVVEPAGRMLDICRRRAEDEGFAQRCSFHEGYVETVPNGDPHHAATCFLVSQFILYEPARCAFFRAIADRLLPEGVLASADLASELDGQDLDVLLSLWSSLMSGAPATPDALERTRRAYDRDAAVLPPARVASIIRAGGFGRVLRFYQASLLHAWLARRS